jgi:hypothetical protein
MVNLIAVTFCDWYYKYCFHTLVIFMTSFLGKYEILECLLKIPGFWDMMPCELVYRYKLVGGAYCLLIQRSQITCHHIVAEWNLHQYCEDFRSWSVCAIMMLLRGWMGYFRPCTVIWKADVEWRMIWVWSCM